LYIQKQERTMKTRVQKWGHSLALRIPKSFATEVGIAQDAVVDVALVDGKLVVTPLPPSLFTLEHLLAGVTNDNLHTEQEIGSAVGIEVW
jgi:antitoxin MazE